jgi:serine/threonine-protein kinase
MGLVFEALHLRLRRQFAIKFLRPDILAMPEAASRFEREARASVRMHGPHVVQIVDVDNDGWGRPYIVMELLRGRDLDAELRERGRFPIAEGVDWILQACAAMGAAHVAGVVHRDLKPSNFFLAESDWGRILKVLDFGISKIEREGEPWITSGTMTVGTPLYMSPEQVRSSRDVDARADIWSLGVILYELLAGAPPFLGTTTAAIAAIVADATPSIRGVRPDVPEQLERVIMTALAKARDDRFPNVDALAAALVPFASADGLASPHSFRPSNRAFVLANSAMARARIGSRVRDASELLVLPSRPCGGEPRPSMWEEALRTFAGTLAIGIGIATGMTLTYPRGTGAQAAGQAQESEVHGLRAPRSPRAQRVEVAAPRGADGRAIPAATVASRPRSLSVGASRAMRGATTPSLQTTPQRAGPDPRNAAIEGADYF